MSPTANVTFVQALADASQRPIEIDQGDEAIAANAERLYVASVGRGRGPQGVFADGEHLAHAVDQQACDAAVARVGNDDAARARVLRGGQMQTQAQIDHFQDLAAQRDQRAVAVAER